MTTYCVGCKWYRPCKDIASWFGLLRRNAEYFAKCGHPHAVTPERPRFTSANALPEPASRFRCDVQNPSGRCADYELKEHR